MGLEQLDTVISFAVVMLLLSLQITILVQLLIAVSGLRGRNLQWGLERLLNQAAPSLKAHASEIVQKVLQHPSLAHTGGLGGRLWGQRRAVAIRLEEFHRVLNDLAKDSNDRLGTTARNALRTTLQTTVPGNTDELAEKASAVLAELTTVLPEKAMAIQEAVSRVMIRTKELEAGVNTWFNTIMDRTSERFVLRTRWITAALAIAFALLLQIDSLQLLKQLSSNSAIRARLVQGAEATLKQAGTVIESTKAPKPLASLAIGAMKEDVGDPDAGLLGAVPSNLITREAGEGWLNKTFPDPAKAARILAVYNKHFDDATISRIKELDASFQEVKQSLDSSSLVIVPSPFPPYSGYFLFENHHLLGTLMTALLLSMGAPFWFNALSQLANLRPALAGKVQKKDSPREVAA